MKRIKHWLATMAVLLCSMTASAYDFMVNDICYNITSDTYLEVEVTRSSDANGYYGTIKIPETVKYNGKTYSVTSIGKSAFEYCFRRLYVTIPRNVVSIQSYAFYESALTSIVIPSDSKLTSIGFAAFNECFELTSIDIPNSVNSIDNSAFSDCVNLTSINIPESLTNIGASTFEDCSSLTAITIPESVTSIGKYAFEGCTGLKTIEIPCNVYSIGTSAFAGCSNLASITCKATIPPTIGTTSFSGVDKSILVNVPVSSVSAYQSADYWDEFANIIGIRNILTSGVCGDNLTWTLYSDGELKIEGAGMMNNYSSSSSSPWYNNSASITKVTLQNGVTSIGSDAFCNCYDLTSVTIPESVTTIEKYAFSYCSSLTSITIPESVTSIGNYAFNRCSSLTSITIPEGVTSLADGAFYGCIRLTSITIPESVTSIGVYAFYDCDGLTNITIPESVTSIGVGAFFDCSSLASITIPEGVTSIEFEAFYGCSSLTNIAIPESVTSIGFGAFSNCSSLASISIPEGVTSIGNEAFYGCSSLTSINIPESVTSIGRYAFFRCSSLISITISERVTSIGNYAFLGCSHLLSITIPESVTSIGSSVFSGCSSLTSIICEAANPPTIDPYTFNGINFSIPVYVPASSVSAYQLADYWNEFTNIQAIYEIITINQYGSATFCSECALDFSEVEGLRAYAATGYKTSTGIVTLTRVMTSQPDMGLFLKGEPGEYVVPTIESTDENSLNMLVGLLESTELNGVSDDGLYYNYRYTIQEGDEEPMFYRVDDNYTHGAGKAYLQIPVAWMPAEARAISLRFDEEDGTADIEEIESIDNGQQPTVVYDLMGRKVANPQKGMVYIVDGKKVVW